MLEVYGTHEVHDALVKVVKKVKIYADVQFIQLNETEDFFDDYKYNIDDLIIFVSARKGSVSHYAGVEPFLIKLEKEMPLNDQILIYPSQEIEENIFSGYEDFGTTPITKGVETIQKIGKEVGSIFKKGSQQG